jgi:protein ImuB
MHIAASLAHWALQFTPRVCCMPPSHDPTLPPQAMAHVLMDVSGCLRLWGGLAALRERLRQSDVGLQSQAWGLTAPVAQARLWLGDEALAPALIDELPLTSLLAARTHLNTLHQIGCSTWGQLAALPRGGITRRFGVDLLRSLDQAYGRQPSQLHWLAPAEVFSIRNELHAQVEQADGLLAVAGYQLQMLQAWLRSRHLGALSLQFVWLLDIRRHAPPQGELVLNTAQPTQDIAHLQRLLAEQLARIELPAPAHTLSLHCLRAEPLNQSSLHLLPEDQRPGQPLHQFIERVASKLGASSVQRPITRPDHRPEAAQAWVDALQAGAAEQRPSKEALLPHQNLRPTWLLKQPLPLLVRQERPYYQGPLTLMHGPERIEASVLADVQVQTQVLAHTEPSARLGAMARDYFVAWSAHAGLLWIYRERAQQEAGWFLHGLFA